jgi:hypothetical protein
MPTYAPKRSYSSVLVFFCPFPFHYYFVPAYGICLVSYYSFILTLPLPPYVFIDVSVTFGSNRRTVARITFRHSPSPDTLYFMLLTLFYLTSFTILIRSLHCSLHICIILSYNKYSILDPLSILNRAQLLKDCCRIIQLLHLPFQ